MTDERSEKNRKLAEWLEPLSSFSAGWQETPENCGGYEATGSVMWYSPLRAWTYTEKNYMDWQPRNFYTDEAANALLLERMTEPHVWKNPDGTWTCEPNNSAGAIDSEIIESGPDKRTAICEAALKLMEAK